MRYSRFPQRFLAGSSAGRTTQNNRRNATAGQSPNHLVRAFLLPGFSTLRYAPNDTQPADRIPSPTQFALMIPRTSKAESIPQPMGNTPFPRRKIPKKGADLRQRPTPSKDSARITRYPSKARAIESSSRLRFSAFSRSPNMGSPTIFPAESTT